jgi:Zn-finger nucleic acid-binding protein
MNSVNSIAGHKVFRGKERLCPSCGIALYEHDLHGQKVDKCPECMGIFFDAGELESILNIVRLYQTVQLSEEDIPNVSSSEIERIMICPFDSAKMNPQKIAGITVDICPECSGIWLDKGEIAALKMFENHIKSNLSLYIRLGN